MLTIFDMNGRLVRQIKTTISAEAKQIVKWDGRSADGTNAPGGIYLVNVSTPAYYQVLKIIKE